MVLGAIDIFRAKAASEMTVETASRSEEMDPAIGTIAAARGRVLALDHETGRRIETEGGQESVCERDHERDHETDQGTETVEPDQRIVRNARTLRWNVEDVLDLPREIVALIAEGVMGKIHAGQEVGAVEIKALVAIML
jgi:hypothetical protein